MLVHGAEILVCQVPECAAALFLLAGLARDAGAVPAPFPEPRVIGSGLREIAQWQRVLARKVLVPGR